MRGVKNEKITAAKQFTFYLIGFRAKYLIAFSQSR